MNKLGYVQWWDSSSGEGMIFCPADNCSYYCHWSAIESEQEIGKKNLNSKQPVQVLLYENLYMKQIDRIKELKYSYDTKIEKLLNDLMNDSFECGCDYIFDLADNYYKELT